VLNNKNGIGENGRDPGIPGLQTLNVANDMQLCECQ